MVKTFYLFFPECEHYFDGPEHELVVVRFYMWVENGCHICEPIMPVEKWCGALLEELYWMQEGNSYTGKDTSRSHDTHVTT